MKYQNFSIRKKILLSNFLMVAVPIICICLIIITLYSAFTYLNDHSNYYFHTFMTETSTYGPTLYVKRIRDHIENTNDDASFQDLFKSLKHNQFQYTMMKNDIPYDTNQKDVFHLIESIGGDANTQSPFFIWNEHGFAYHTTLNNKSSDKISLWIASDDVRWSIDGDMSWKRIKSIIIITIICATLFIIISIILAGIYLSKKLSKLILIPLEALTQETLSIQSGDLTHPVDISSEDEIGVLAQNFENMRKQLLESKQLQAKYHESRKEMISGLTHDIYTPFTSIQGYVDALLEGIYTSEDKQKEALYIIQKECNRMHDLLSALSTYSKLDVADEGFHDVTFDINEWLYEWIHSKKMIANGQNIQIHTSLCKEELKVCMDPKICERIFENLFNNSHKYRRNSALNIFIDTFRHNQYATIIFKDDGIGVTNDALDKIFDMFYRSDPSRSSNIKGNGLGLSIVKKMIMHYDGTIIAKQAIPHGLIIEMKLLLEEKE